MDLNPFILNTNPLDVNVFKSLANGYKPMDLYGFTSVDNGY